MPVWGWIIIGVVVLLVGACVALYIFGTKMQKKQQEAEQQMEMMKQTLSLLIIDKQKKKMKESGLPDMVIEQAPWYSKRMKVPVVKCKIGPKIMTMIADEKVYEILPVKKTCTVTVSGIYITELKAVRGGSVPKAPVKKNIFRKMTDKVSGTFANLKKKQEGTPEQGKSKKK